MQDLLRELAAAIENRQSVVLATIVEVEVASPARPGFKLLVRADGSWLGNVPSEDEERKCPDVYLQRWHPYSPCGWQAVAVSPNLPPS